MNETRPTMRVSAGILLFRRGNREPEVLLGHPGGPFFAQKDRGHWSIPKGEVEPGEALLTVAVREFAEETGHVVGTANLIPLGSIRQRGGKVVHAWAVEGNLDPATATSNTFQLQWPPHSGITIDVPELDRVAWFTLREARETILPAQVPLIDRLEEALRG